jgi:hypothetical protein
VMKIIIVTIHFSNNEGGKCTETEYYAPS